MEKLYEHTLQRQLELQAAQIAELASSMHQLQMRMQLPHVTQVADTIVNSCLQQQININVFGSESIAHIDRPTIKALLDDVLKDAPDPAQGAIAAFLGAAMLIYSDPAHPENLTCYLPNNKNNDVLVHGKAGWAVQPYTVVLPPMAMKSLDALFVNQPFENADRYGDLMKALGDNERAYREGKEMRTVLVRNKGLLQKALGALPR